MNVAVKELLPSAEQLTQETLTIIARDGLGRSALEKIGNRLADFAAQMPLFVSDADELVIRSESDGTFELVLKVLKVADRPAPMLAYDTWSAYAVSHGRVTVRNAADERRVLTVGQSACFEQGMPVSLAAEAQDAQICCIFGIAREHLPPPNRY